MRKMKFVFLPLLICTLFYSCAMPGKPGKPEVQTKPVRVSAEKALDRPSYSMKYYADWPVDSSDADFDLDSYFSLNTPSGTGSISFFIFNTAVEETDYIDAQIQAHLEKTIRNGTVTRFSKWGSYTGHGALITGKIMGAMKGEIRIFVHSSEHASFLVVHQIYNSDREQDEPGLKLMESSFRMKEDVNL